MVFASQRNFPKSGKKSSKNPCNSKIFVYLPPIVRGNIRAVEGNLCLYPEIRNLENFEKGYLIRICQPILHSIGIIECILAR